MANDAPTGKDNTFYIDNTAHHAFKVTDFGFEDVNGDAFLGVIFLTGHIYLNGKMITPGQFVPTADLDKMEWLSGTPMGPMEGTSTFQVVDDGGTADGGQDTDQTPNTLYFVDKVDRIIGTRHSDRLLGTNGPDIIDGKKGNDHLRGNYGFDSGIGKDVFVFGKDYGKDVIGGFADYDAIDLSALPSIRNFRDLQKNHLEVHGDNYRIDGGNGDILVLRDTARWSQLESDNFIF